MIPPKPETGWTRIEWNVVTILTRHRMAKDGIDLDANYRDRLEPGQHVAYLIISEDDATAGESMAILEGYDLREALASLRALSVRCYCLPEERAALDAMLDAVLEDRRVKERRH